MMLRMTYNRCVASNGQDTDHKGGVASHQACHTNFSYTLTPSSQC